MQCFIFYQYFRRHKIPFFETISAFYKDLRMYMYKMYKFYKLAENFLEKIMFIAWRINSILINEQKKINRMKMLIKIYIQVNL